MSLYDQEIRKQSSQRARELLVQGLTNKQVAARTGLTVRAVLRIKRRLEDHAREAASA